MTTEPDPAELEPDVDEDQDDGQDDEPVLPGVAVTPVIIRTPRRWPR